MDFKKIDISRKDLEKLASDLYQTYTYAEFYTAEQCMEYALEKLIFNVTFEEDHWNDATVTPPVEFSERDALIRGKDCKFTDDKGYTFCAHDYTVAMYSAEYNDFLTTQGCKFFDLNDRSRYEYKFIK